MDVFDVFKELFDPKLMKVIQLFLQSPDKRFTLDEVTSKTRIPKTTAFRILNKLLKAELIKQKKIKTLKIYLLEENERTKLLKDSLDVSRNALDSFVNACKDITGVQTIILHGEKTDQKANLLIIGNKIDTSTISTLAGDIKDRYNFSIIFLTLEPAQFEQMSSMGLYSGKKQVLHHNG